MRPALIRFLDLTAEPRLMDATETLFVDAVHLNARGHRVIAETIAERLPKSN